MTWYLGQSFLKRIAAGIVMGFSSQGRGSVLEGGMGYHLRKGQKDYPFTKGLL